MSMKSITDRRIILASYMHRPHIILHFICFNPPHPPCYGGSYTADHSSKESYLFSVPGTSCCGTPSPPRPGEPERPAARSRCSRCSCCRPSPAPRSPLLGRRKTCRAGRRSSPGWPAPGERAAAPPPPSWLADSPESGEERANC